MSAEAIVNLLAREVLNPIMALLFAVGLLLFVYGLVEFLWSLSKGSHKQLMAKNTCFGVWRECLLCRPRLLSCGLLHR